VSVFDVSGTIALPPSLIEEWLFIPEQLCLLTNYDLPTGSPAFTQCTEFQIRILFELALGPAQCPVCDPETLGNNIKSQPDPRLATGLETF
jgi:hypothetical protein